MRHPLDRLDRCVGRVCCPSRVLMPEACVQRSTGGRPGQPPPRRAHQALQGHCRDPAQADERSELRRIPQAACRHRQAQRTARHSVFVVAQGFFWLQEKDLADKAKTVWTTSPRPSPSTPRAARAGRRSDGYSPIRPAHRCRTTKKSSARRQAPTFDASAFDALDQVGTQTEPPDWAYISQGWHRRARRRAADRARTQKARHDPGARPARRRAARPGRWPFFSFTSPRRPARAPFVAARCDRAARGRTRCATSRMPAAGRSPAISAARTSKRAAPTTQGHKAAKRGAIR